MRQFKDVVKENNSYRIMNDWTYSYVETLDADKAKAKYGDCIYHGGRITGFNGADGHEITVWLDCWN